MMGFGMFMQSLGEAQANRAEASAERDNASYYREQAAFAQKTGERQELIFDRESKILHGDQASAFAKNGVNTQSSALFMAKEALFTSQERVAIQDESAFNVRLATMRARTSNSKADALNHAARMATFSAVAGAGSKMS